MPEMLNPFETDAFNMVSLTKAVNILPNKYGRIQQMNLMPIKGVRGRTVIVEERNGILNLLPTQPVGSPGTVAKRGKRKVRSFVIPHIPHDDFIDPSEYAGVRAFGSGSAMETLAALMNDHLQTLRNKHAITLEHLRVGGLKGIILDADGSTLYNLYDEFGITQKTVNFALTTADTNVHAKCRAVLRHIEDNLKGEVMNDVHALVDQDFFDALIGHPNVEKFWVNHEQAVNFAESGKDPRKGFKFGGITWEEYRGTADDPDGNARKFIAANEGHCFPTGTMSTFETLAAPADFIETANTIGQEVYVKQEPRKFNRGIDLHSQSNPLPMCYRPALLVKVRKS